MTKRAPDTNAARALEKCAGDHTNANAVEVRLFKAAGAEATHAAAGTVCAVGLNPKTNRVMIRFEERLARELQGKGFLRASGETENEPFYADHEFEELVQRLGMQPRKNFKPADKNCG